MPVLDRATYEALTESIREHGVIVPIVKDQHGNILDGFTRLEIAESLGVPVPEVIHECAPEQREVLRIELNGARRQLRDDQWKPLVDHLRDCGYSDRVIAKAVGVDRHQVQRYKSPEDAGGPPGPPASKKSVGEDGKKQVVGGEWTAVDRVLHLIRASDTGLTVGELQRDEILAEFSESTVARIPGALRDKGLVEAAGTRDRATIWRAAQPTEAEPAPAPDPALQRKAERLMNKDLLDPEFVAAAKAVASNAKDVRQLERLIQQAEKEATEARLAEEKRQAEIAKAELREAEIARDTKSKSLDYWDGLENSIRAETAILASLLREFDNFPPVSQAYVREVERALDELQHEIDLLRNRIHPQHQPTFTGAIDV